MADLEHTERSIDMSARRAKIVRIAQDGATEGEKAAAREALRRMDAKSELSARVADAYRTPNVRVSTILDVNA